MSKDIKQIAGRVTAKKFIEWLNKEFERFEIKEYVVTRVERTRYRSQDYEDGAAFLQVYFNYKDESKRGPFDESSFLCFYSFGMYEEYLKKGYELCLKFEDYRMLTLSNLTVDVRKKTNP